MIVTNAQQAVERVGEHGGGRFTIKASAKAFSILTDKLYSNKPLAIVRELACNAWDSHVAAGKQNTAIEIQLPTYLNPTLYVKDFGVGLDDHQIRGRWVTQDDEKVWEHGIYTTFFDSSKTGSNDYIGALGLGSKSPFSYSKSFFVSSRFNGTIYTYTMFLNESGEPEVQLMGQAPTDEVNGVTVELAIKQDDIYQFIQAAKTALIYFQPKAVVKGNVGFEPFQVEHTFTGTGWKLRNSEWAAGMTGPRVVQGFVSYPIEILQLGELDASHRLVADLSVDVYVDIGAVDIAPSREHLSYDATTVNNLKNALAVVADELRDVFQQQLNQCTNYWDAVQQHLVLSMGANRQVYTALAEKQSFTFDDYDILDDKVVVVGDLGLLELHDAVVGSKKVTMTKKETASRDDLSVTKLHITKDKQVIVADVSKGQQALIRWLCGKNKSQHALVIKVPTLAQKNAALTQQVNQQIDVLVDRLGGCPISRLSDHVEHLKTIASLQPSKYKAKPKGHYNTFLRLGRDHRGYKRVTFSHVCWHVEAIDISEGGIYVPINRHTIIDRFGGVMQMPDIDDYVEAAIALNIIDRDDLIVGFNEKQWSNIDEDDKQEWSCLFDLIRTHIQSPSAIDQWTAGRLQSRLLATVPHLVAMERMARLGNLIIDDDFCSALLAVTDITTRFDEAYSSLNVLHSLGGTVLDGLQKTPHDQSDKMISHLNRQIDRFPLLSMINWSHLDDDGFLKVIDYMNLQSSRTT
jgi:hypothetical protein